MPPRPGKREKSEYAGGKPPQATLTNEKKDDLPGAFGILHSSKDLSNALAAVICAAPN